MHSYLTTTPDNKVIADRSTGSFRVLVKVIKTGEWTVIAHAKTEINAMLGYLDNAKGKRYWSDFQIVEARKVSLAEWTPANDVYMARMRNA